MDWIQRGEQGRFRALISVLVVLVYAASAVGCSSDEVADNQTEGEFTVGGEVEGLESGELVLQLNGDFDLHVDEDGDFVFDAELSSGDDYEVTVAEQPDEHLCHVANASGTIDDEDIRDVQALCTLEPDEEEEPEFYVDIDEAQSSLVVDEGEPIVVEAEVENLGQLSGVQDVVFEVDGDERGMHSALELEAFDSDVVTFEWPTEAGDAGEYTVSVITEDDDDSAEAQVIGPPFLEVQIDTDLSSLEVPAGERVEVVVELENTGGREAIQDVELWIDGEVQDTRSNISVDGGQTGTYTLHWETGPEDLGSFDAEVTTDDDDDATEGVVLEPAHFEVSIDEEESILEVERGDEVVVAAQVENIGEVEGTQDIGFEIDGDFADVSVDFTVDAGETEEVSFEWETDGEEAGEYEATVLSGDDSDEATVVVLEPAFLAVSIDEEASTLEVEEGEWVVVVADVENQGDVADTQNIVLEIDGSFTDVETDLEVAGQGVETVQLEWETESGDAGDFTATVQGPDDGDDAEGTVYVPAYLEVSIDDQESTLEVEEGQTVVVEVTVTNTGEVEDTQDFALQIDGDTVDEEIGVTVAGGASETVVLEWTTQADDAGEFTAEVVGDHDTDQIQGQVLEPAFFAVSIDEQASELNVEEGDPVVVEAEITNTGDVDDTQNIVLEIDGDDEDVHTNLEVTGGATESVTLEWETEDGDADTYSVEVSSDDDSAQTTAEVVVPPDAEFVVTIDEGDSTLEVEATETVVVEAEIQNDGGEADTQDIVLEIDGDEVDRVADVQVGAGETEAVTLEWNTGADDAGTYTARVSSDDDADTAAVTVQPRQEATFAVTIDEAESTLVVEEGQTVVVEADVENTGGQTGTQDITLHIGGAEVDVVSDVELTVGASESVILEWETGEGDDGTHDATVASDDDTDTVSVEVEPAPEPAYFAVSIDEQNSTLEVDEGDTVIVEATVENTGDEADTQDITLEIEGEQVDVASGVELAGGDTQTVRLEWETEDGDDGTHEATVASENETDSTNVDVTEVLQTAYFAVDIDENASTLEVDEGQTIEVVAVIENTGDEADTQDVILEIDGFFEDLAEDVELDGGESQTVTLEWETEMGEDGTYDAEVSSADEGDVTTVTVISTVATLSGLVVDADPEDPQSMEGVEVLLLEPGTDDVVATDIVASDDAYEIGEVDVGDYDLRLQAAGLEPNYGLEEAGGDSTLEITLSGGENTQDLTVDWTKITHLIVDGGVFDLDANDPESDFAFELPECEFDPEADGGEGAWVPIHDEEEETVTFDPDDECFRIDDVAIDLVTGEFTVVVDTILFPDINVYMDDFEDDGGDVQIDSIDVDFFWRFDDVGGYVDFTDGAMATDLDTRILIGGNVSGEAEFLGVTFPFSENFGERDDEFDCQLTELWGGRGASEPPIDDTDDEQDGDYLHDPIQMRLTTGDSGGYSGEPYDEELAFFVTVDNEMEIDRLSEGQYGEDDPGGASCGEDDTGDVDFAESINDMAELPSEPGDVLGEFDFLIPQH